MDRFPAVVSVFEPGADSISYRPGSNVTLRGLLARAQLEPACIHLIKASNCPVYHIGSSGMRYVGWLYGSSAVSRKNIRCLRNSILLKLLVCVMVNTIVEGI
jgi:hypothetical protein